MLDAFGKGASEDIRLAKQARQLPPAQSSPRQIALHAIMITRVCQGLFSPSRQHTL